MKYFLFSLALFSIGFASLGLAADDEDTKHKPFFEKLKKAYEADSSKPATLKEFNFREQILLGECVSEYDFSGPYYSRDEHYLPIINHKTAPGQRKKLQFASIDVGGNPYSSRHIDEPKDAIWYLRGNAGERISNAYLSEDYDALVADYYEDGDIIALKKGKLNGAEVYLYVRFNSDSKIEEACYFDENVL